MSWCRPRPCPAPDRYATSTLIRSRLLPSRPEAFRSPIGLVGDDFEAQRAAGTEGLSRGDLLVFSAGSSVSSRDMTAEVIGSLGSPGVLVHGIAHKPGKPTIVAMVEGKPVFGLPGNPVSAVDVFQMLVRPSIYALCGCDSAPQPRTVTARPHSGRRIRRRPGGPRPGTPARARRNALRRAGVRQIEPGLHASAIGRCNHRAAGQGWLIRGGGRGGEGLLTPSRRFR